MISREYQYNYAGKSPDDKAEIRYEMWQEQGYVCPICCKSLRNPMDEYWEDYDNNNQGTCSSVVDHCHTSGLIRGLLCRQCNSGLGMFKDSKPNLRRASEYLGKYDSAP